MRIVALTLSLCCATALAQDVVTLSFDPAAVRPDRTAPIALTVGTTGSVAKVRLDFALFEGSIQLQPVAGTPGLWRTNLSPAPLLALYQSDDVGRLLIGSLKLFDAAGAQVGPVVRMDLPVLDSAMSPVLTATFASQMRITKHVVNLLRPATKSAEVGGHPQITHDFYKQFGDDYDFLNIVYELPSFRDNRGHYGVRDATQGVSAHPGSDRGAEYGSAARLIGITGYPLSSLFDLADTGSVHELGHQWVNFTEIPLLGAIPHWSHSTMAHDAMGTSLLALNNEGVQFPWAFQPQQDGTFRWTASPAAADNFNDFDLYLMGLIPASAVAPQRVALTDAEHCEGCPVATKVVTVNDIINVLGLRIPNASASQKDFRMATIIVTRDRLLSDDELAYFDFFARRASASSKVQMHNGFQKIEVKPWKLATRGLSTIDPKLVMSPILLLILNDIRLTPITEGGPFTLKGQGFRLPLTVKVDGVPATAVRVLDANTLTFKAPRHRKGPADIVITQGRVTVRLPEALLYR